MDCLCREAAVENSPGLSALGKATNEIALKVATEALGWCQVLEQLRIAMFARPTESTHRAQNKPFGRFQRGSLCLRYPGLKPWAMMYNRFAVNPTGSQA